MKKAISVFAIIAALTACNNSDKGTGTGPSSTDADTTATQVQHVQNANGNIPDTTNSINIGTETPNPATKDSAKH